LLLAAHCFLRGGDRSRTPDGDRRDHAREEHRIAHRDEDQRVFGQRLDRGRGRARARRRGLALLVFVRKHLLVHAPSFLRKVSVSTPSPISFAASSIGRYGSWSGSTMRRSKRPYGISMRWMWAPVSRQGDGGSGTGIKSVARFAPVFRRLALLVGRLSLRVVHRRALVLVPEVDPAASDVVGRDLEAHAIARQDADAVLAHAAAGVGEHVGA